MAIDTLAPKGLRDGALKRGFAQMPQPQPHWVSFLYGRPSAMEVVLVHSEEWKFPKVLQFVPWQQQHRLYEVEGPEKYYYYPERMHWMRIPQKPASE